VFETIDQFIPLTKATMEVSVSWFWFFVLHDLTPSQESGASGDAIQGDLGGHAQEAIRCP
jgi:hypothetical protein